MRRRRYGRFTKKNTKNGHFTKKFHKNERISAYTQPTKMIFGTVLDMVGIFYHTKNQVGGLCVGGVSGVLPRMAAFLRMAAFTATQKTHQNSEYQHPKIT